MRMIKYNDIKADLHTHTIFSKHAYSTIEENVRAARDKGMQFIAITDHFYYDGSELEKKNEINRIKYLEERVKPHSDSCIVGGAEFNIGHLGAIPEKLKDLKWKLIGLHNWFVPTKSIPFDNLYDLFFNESYRGYNAFAHIERELWRIQTGHFSYTFEDTEKFLKDVVHLAKEKNIFLEVNEWSVKQDEFGAVERMKCWLKEAKEVKCNLCLGTDAHYSGEIGDFKNSVDLLNELEYPKDLILNCNFSWMKELFDND